jgi:autophagy-related protein 101
MMAMTPPSHVLEIFSDQLLVRDLVKGILHTIFFHRYFPSIRPSLYTPGPSSTSSTSSQTALPIPLPAILDPPDIAAAIETHVATLVAQLTSPSPGNVPPGGSRGEIVVQFFDRKRRKTGYTGGWLGRLGGGGNAQTDVEVCWEEWCLQVVVARPRSEAGEMMPTTPRPPDLHADLQSKRLTFRRHSDRIKVRRAMESSLQKTAMKIVSIVNREKEHIPPITTSEQNPFPYRVLVNPKLQQDLDRGFGGWN